MNRLKRLLGLARAAVARSVDVEVWFYNLDNYRPDKIVERELRSIASSRPAVIALCEVIGNRLPELRGYRLLRDGSSKSRENIAAYVRDDLPVKRIRWTDLRQTWGRTDGPGQHEARSYLTFWIGWWQITVAHQPPKGTDNVIPAQQEGIDALTRIMAPWKRSGWSKRSRSERLFHRLVPRLLVMDGNRRADEPGPGPGMLAERVGGTVHLGDRIDHAVRRGSLVVLSAVKLGRVNGMVLLSDHEGAIRLRVRVAAWWLA